MSQIKELLTKELQGLFDAETQLTVALPKMADAATHPKVKEAFQKHLTQTQAHAGRLRTALEMFNETTGSETCLGMQGLIAEGEKVISEGSELDPLAADLALIAAAQKVEHYEIAAYGTARSLARQLNMRECERLLSHTLGEEESTDFLLSSISEPLLQQLTLNSAGGAHVSLERGDRKSAGVRARSKAEKGAA